MNVLVTGGAGFIGSHVARALVEAGHTVHVLALPTESMWRLGDVETRLRIARGDLGEPGTARALVEAVRPEACVHLAWYAAPGKYLSAPENLGCVTATLDLARELAAAGCKRFVGAGTCFEYDLSGDVPLRESSATAPAQLYAGCKLAAYHALAQYFPSVGMTFAWLRFFYLYGPYEAEARLVPAVVRALLAGEQAKTSPGAQVRDFLHVEDVASAVVRLLAADVQGVVNVASGRPITVRALVEAIGRACGRPDLVAHGALPYRAGDPMYVCADVTRLRATGWTERFDLDTGLRHCAVWWAHRLRASLEEAHA